MRAKDDGVQVITAASKNAIASFLKMTHSAPMRTTITMDDDVHEFASIYAAANGITLSRAVGELIRKAQAAPAQPQEVAIQFLPNGFPIFPPTGRTITDELVKEIEEEEFDPQVSS